MKIPGKITFLAIFALLLFTSVSYANLRVAVMDFENTTHGGSKVGGMASDMLATELVKSGKFDIYERSRLESIMKEQNLAGSGRFDPTTAAKIGKIIGVQYIIIGSVTKNEESKDGFGFDKFKLGKKNFHAGVDAKMVDTDNAQIVLACSASHTKASIGVSADGRTFNSGDPSKTEAMRCAVAELVQKINNHPWILAQTKIDILVADVDGDTIALNNGRSAGLSDGQQVTISRVKKIIKDPRTGKVIKVRYKKVGAIVLNMVEYAYAEGKVISGSGFQVGDIVK